MQRRRRCTIMQALPVVRTYRYRHGSDKARTYVWTEVASQSIRGN